MKTISALLILGLLILGVSAQADSATTCGGCAEVALLEKKLAALKPNNDEAATPLIIKATKAVRLMPTQKGRKLAAEQILAVSRLLASAYPNDADYSIIDGNLKLFQANEKAFFATFKTFPKKDAENLASELDVKLGEAKYGQDSDPDAEPAPKKLKH